MPVPALPDTVFVTAQDTVRDTVFHYLGRAPSPFPVKVDDPFSWVAPAATIAGVLIGGWLSAQAGKAAIRDEWKLDKEEGLNRLLKRIRSNLRRVQALSERVRDHPPDSPFPADVGDEPEVLWNTYYRVSEPIFGIDDDALSERVDDFFQRVRKAGFLIRGIEERSKAGHPQAFRVERGEQRDVILALGEEAAELLGELEGINAAALVKRTPGRKVRP